MGNEGRTYTEVKSALHFGCAELLEVMVKVRADREMQAESEEKVESMKEFVLICETLTVYKMTLQAKFRMVKTKEREERLRLKP